MARAVEDVLALWREGERLLELLPATSPDRKVVQLEVARLRRVYRQLTARADATHDQLAASGGLMERSAIVLRRASDRLDSRA